MINVNVSAFTGGGNMQFGSDSAVMVAVLQSELITVYSDFKENLL